jgi:hypothetical protein
MHSDSETGEKVATERRKSSAAFVNYHFLDKNDKLKIDKDLEIAEEEEAKNFVSNIPVIQNTIELKKDLINSGLDQEEEENKVKDLNLNTGTKELLNKYRRESVNLPYAESFFQDLKSKQVSERKDSLPSTPIKINNIIPRRNSSAQIENTEKFKIDSNRRKSTAAFVNFHFLNKNEKKNESKSISSI